MAKETVEALLERDVPVIFIITNDAKLVWQEEMDEPLAEVMSRWKEHPHFTQYAVGDMKAPVASGTLCRDVRACVQQVLYGAVA
jgi:3-polyprenyl-4-hydroxybenzoate decarboxylase